MNYRVIDRIVSLFAISLCAYIFYATIWGPYKTTIVHRAIFLGVMMIIFFWSAKPLGRGRLSLFIDTFIVLIIVFALGYVVIFWRDILAAIGGTYLSTLQILVGFFIILFMLEGVRRVSLPLFILALIAIGYILYGDYLPGILSHAGMGVKRFIYLTAYSHEGIFGLALAVASTYLFMFILFSTALQESGASDFFLRLTSALVGKTRGSSAKSAVVASGLTGTMIGSSIGNVVTTGSITIPMMKRSGFKPETAAAIEVVASEGAQLVPPIMGAGAFLMAELTGIPYWTICWAAIIPALFYYVSVFVVVDMECVKLRMRGRDKVEKARKVIMEGIHHLIPLALLFYLLLVTRLTVTYAGLITVLFTIGINQLRKKTRLNFRQIMTIFDQGTRRSAELTALIGVIGIVQAAFTITGLGPRLSELLVLMAGARPIFILIMAMVIALILGMGMPTPIAYILSGLFVAPAMVEVGFSKLASHLFCFFFAIKSGSTPPIAVVAVVGAGIAVANWWKTAWISFAYSIPGFVIAFAFMFYPSYLMEGIWTNILPSLIFGLIGVSGLAYAMQRHLLTKLALWEVLFLGLGSLILVILKFVNPIFGLILVILACFSQWRKWRSNVRIQTASTFEGERR
jgi:TRAP transporter 4TM/12TM fusion protein